MKKGLFLSLVLFPAIVLAQAAAPSAPVASHFDLKVFVQQLLTNGGLALLAFLAGMIPGSFGGFVKKAIDFFSANMEHKS